MTQNKKVLSIYVGPVRINLIGFKRKSPLHSGPVLIHFYRLGYPQICLRAEKIGFFPQKPNLFDSDLNYRLIVFLILLSSDKLLDTPIHSVVVVFLNLDFNSLMHSQQNCVS